LGGAGGKEKPVRKEFGYSLRRNDSPSMISRSAQDLPKAMMTYPIGLKR
jgi:hypothetical protein